MKTSGEIKNSIENIRYYSDRIKQLASEQLDSDMGRQAMEPEPGSVRLDCLGAMISGGDWIQLYCTQIESNLKHAEVQDSKLEVNDDR